LALPAGIITFLHRILAQGSAKGESSRGPQARGPAEGEPECQKRFAARRGAQEAGDGVFQPPVDAGLKAGLGGPVEHGQATTAARQNCRLPMRIGWSVEARCR